MGPAERRSRRERGSDVHFAKAAIGSGALRPAALGLALGFDALGHCLAIATLVFAGPLAQGLGLGSALFLLSSLVGTLALIRWSGLPNALGVAQDATIAILAGVVAGAVAQDVAPEARLVTALAVIGLSTLASGLVLYLMGALGLGRLARAVPYPVALGFLASSGWLLTFAALSIIADGSGPAEVFAALIRPETLPVSAPAAALALGLVVTLRLWSGAAGMMLVLGLSLAGFYLVLALLGMSLEEARLLGLVPGRPDTGGGGFGMGWQALGRIDWEQVALAAPGLAVIVVVNVIAVFLNTTGAELATRSDLDMNQELRRTGQANIVLGLLGGVTSFVSTGSTIVAHRFGGGHRALAYSYAAVILIGGVFAGQIVAVVPVFLTAGLLLFFGISMLEDWLLRPLGRLVLQDRLIVLAVVGVTAVSGIFAAIAAGLAFALAAFVVSYARVPMLRHRGTRQPRRSIVERDPGQEAILREGWSRVRLAQLQGYLFFGSIEQLLAEVRAPRDGAGPGGWLILDFAAVTGLDSSTCAALEKLSYLASTHGVRLRLCALSPDLLRFLTRWNPNFAADFGFALDDTLEDALEAVEEALLAGHPAAQAAGGGLEKLLAVAAPLHPRLDDLRQLLERRELREGEVLIRAGSTLKDIYVVESGRLAVFLDGAMRQRVRVRVFAAGAVVGEVARYLSLPRTADVVSQGASSVHCLPAATLDRLEAEDAELAALIHAILARGLAEKVVRTNLLVSD